MARFFCLSLMMLLPFFLHAQENFCPLQVGRKIPGTLVFDAAGEPASLRKITEGKKSVMVFYRGGWCPYCQRQLSQLAEIEPELKALGFQIIAISADAPEALHDLPDGFEPGYELYSDQSMEAAEAFGIAFRLDEDTWSKYQERGYNMGGEESNMLPVPTVFLVDEDGIIHFVYANPDYKIRLDGETLLAAAKAMGLRIIEE